MVSYLILPALLSMWVRGEFVIMWQFHLYTIASDDCNTYHQESNLQSRLNGLN